MDDMDECCTYTRDGDHCRIECKLGLWAVEGPFGLDLINEAYRYYAQYKADGEYTALLAS